MAADRAFATGIPQPDEGVCDVSKLASTLCGIENRKTHRSEVVFDTSGQYLRPVCCRSDAELNSGGTEFANVSNQPSCVSKHVEVRMDRLFFGRQRHKCELGF